MGSSQGLYEKVVGTLAGYHPGMRVTRLRMWAWLIVGLLQGQSVHLSEIALMIPGEAQAAGRIMRVRRWLANRWLTPRALYRPFIRESLRQWRGRSVTLVIDATFTERKRLQVVRVGVSHCFRTIPIAWMVLARSGLVSLSTCSELLEEVASVIGRRKRVTLLGDRGFRGWAWAAQCRQYHWNYILRVANDTLVYLPNGRCYRVDHLAPPKGKSRYLTDVRLTKQQWRCNLAMTWTRKGELCVLMTNRPASYHILHAYIRRMHIEQSFRDDKSGAFDLAASRLTDPRRLDALLLVIALATLWLFWLGDQLLASDRRATIDPAHRRHLSIFQLGWRFLRRALACDHPPPFRFILRPLPLDPIRPTNC